MQHLEKILDEDIILEKCLEDSLFFKSFSEEYEDYLHKVDWNYFLVVVIESHNSWNSNHFECIQKNFEHMFKAAYKKKINFDFNDLKQLHIIAQNTHGKDYHKTLLKHIPEIKKYAFKLYMKNKFSFKN